MNMQSSKPVKGEQFNHSEVENKWKSAWERTKLDVALILNDGQASVGRPKFYNLMMFPYPSAEGLHVGNMYAFTGSDIYGRFKRMQGFEVFEPIGLDGFGIHSENYALKIGKHPMDQAKVSEKNFYKQLSSIGAMFDWTRTVQTYDPDYYKWTQWLFIQMFKHGLAYRGKAEVNWCPKDKTVLADEQVIEGKCERCGNIVEKKLLEQWFFRITAYAGKLLENLNSLDWSAVIKIAQNNWIGKKEGINITYQVVDEKGNSVGDIICFTTRPDTNFGATFVVIAPEHPFITHIKEVIKTKELVPITRYIEETKNKSKEERIAQGREKTGVFTGLFCLNQLNGNKLPLYVSDFVVMSVGTGAVVGVPASDIRDFEFAKKFNLPITRVIYGEDGYKGRIENIAQVCEEGKLMNSEFLNGLIRETAIPKMMDYLEKKGWGKRVTTYHLRDWLISRQRYWGPPIPMVFCKLCHSQGKSWFTTEEAKILLKNPKSQIPNPKQSQISKFQAGLELDACDLELAAERAAGWYPVLEDKLPVVLPRIEDYKPGDDGIAPLAKHKEFYETNCLECGAKAVRETDVSDTFLDSSWYFLKYPSVGLMLDDRNSKLDFEDRRLKVENQISNIQSQCLTSSVQRPTLNTLPWDPAITKKWLPVDMYTGGAEHSVLHLMYSRFTTMALHDWGYLDFEEPFTRFFAHGLIIKEGAKMSKSKGNVVNPDEYIKMYGIDALRLYLMFMGPFSEGGDFRDSAMEGMYRWINRVWRLITAQISNLKSEVPNKSKIQNSKPETKLALNKLVAKVTDDVEKRRYNTAIASMMEFTNLVAENGGALELPQLKTFILLLAPFAPFLAEEIWQRVYSMIDDRNSKVDIEAGRSKIENQFSNFQSQNPTSNFKRPISNNFHSVHREPWPTFNPKLMVEEVVEIVVQVNGKLRDTLRVQSEKSKAKEKIESLARGSEKVKKYLEDKGVTKVIFIPGRLINFVLN